MSLEFNNFLDTYNISYESLSAVHGEEFTVQTAAQLPEHAPGLFQAVLPDGIHICPLIVTAQEVPFSGVSLPTTDRNGCFIAICCPK